VTRWEGYTQAIRNRISVDWNVIPELILNPLHIPPEVQMKAALLSNQGRPSLLGPGKLESVDLNPYLTEKVKPVDPASILDVFVTV
jgi:type III restriction enzyme